MNMKISESNWRIIVSNIFDDIPYYYIENNQSLKQTDLVRMFVTATTFFQENFGNLKLKNYA